MNQILMIEIYRYFIERKKYFLLPIVIALLLFSLGMASAATYTVEDSDTTNTGVLGAGSTNSFWYGTFTATSSYTLSNISLILENRGTPADSNISVTLYTVSGNEPDTFLTASNDVYTTADIPSEGSGIYTSFSFDGYNLTNAVEYAVVVNYSNLVGNDGSNTPLLRYSNVAGDRGAASTFGTWSVSTIQRLTYQAFSCSGVDCFTGPYFTLQATDVYSSSSINNFTGNVTYNGTTTEYNTTNGTIVTDILKTAGGDANITFTSDNYFTNQSLNINSSEDYSATLTPYTQVNVFSYNGSTINNFTALYQGTEYNTSSGIAYIPLFNETAEIQVYNAILGGVNYVNQTNNFTASPYLQDANFTLYAINTLLLYFYDLETLSLINTQTVNVSLVGSLQTYNRNTSNGSILAELLNPDTYEITASSSGYSDATVFSTLNNDNSTINMYLDPNTLQDITFSVISTLDEDIGNATITLTRNINGSVVTVAQQITDAFGQAIIELDQTATYYITVTADGYSTFEGVFQPVSTQYTVSLEPSGADAYVSFFDLASIDGPTFTYNQTTQILIIDFDAVSSTGAINFFGMNTTYNAAGYGQNISGSAGGGSIQINISPANTTLQDKVTVDYFLNVNGYDTYSNKAVFYISQYTQANTTISGGLFPTTSETGVSTAGLALLGTIAVLISFGFTISFTGKISAGAVAGALTTGGLTIAGVFGLVYGIIVIVLCIMMLLGDAV